MSFIKKFFRSRKSKKERKKPTPQEDIRTQGHKKKIEMLTKKSESLEKKIEQQLSIAKKNKTTNRKAALRALKRKRQYMKQLQKIDFQLEKAMRSAATTLQSAHNNIDADKVMDDVAEQQEIAQEISDAISNPVGFEQDMDDDDLLAELEKLEQENVDEKLLNVAEPIVDLPSIPMERPAVAKAKAKPVEDDDDLMKLEAWAS